MPRSLGVLALTLCLTSPLFAAGAELGVVNPEAPAPLASHDVATNGSGFLAAWTVSSWLGFTYRELYVAPVDVSGMRGPATLIASGPFVGGRVIAIGDHYELLWSDGSTLHMFTVAGDGGILRRLRLGNHATGGIAASDGRRIVFASQFHIRAARLLIIDTADGSVSEKVLPLPEAGGITDLTFAGNEFVLAYSQWVFRFSLDDLRVTAKTLLSVAQVQPMVAPAEGGGALVVFKFDHARLLISTVAPDGSITSTFSLSDHGLYRVSWWRVTKSGTQFLLTFAASPDPKAPEPTALYAISLASDGRPIGSPAELLPYPVHTPALAVAAGHAFVIGAGRAALVDVQDDVQVLHSGVFATVPSRHRDLAVATDGVDFLATFTEFAHLKATVYARLGFDGRPVSAAARSTSTLHNLNNTPAVAFGGNVYLHVASQRGAIAVRRISAQGAVLDEDPILITTATGRSPAVASDGVDFLVVWSDSAGLRGTIVTAQGIVKSVNTLVTAPQWTGFDDSRIAFDGSRFVVTYGSYQTTGFPTVTLNWTINAVAVTREGVAGEPVSLFTANHPYASIASSGRDFLVVGTVSDELVASTLTGEGTSLRTGPVRTLFRGFPSARASVAWNGGAYVAAWRFLGPFAFTVSVPESFLAVTHLRTDGVADPIATIPTGIYPDSYLLTPPAIAVNKLGTELIVVDEIRGLGASARAVAYRSSELNDRVQPPTAPIITSVKQGPDGVTLSWNPTSNNERGFVIAMNATSPGQAQFFVPSGSTSYTVAEQATPSTFIVSAWNEGGFSPASKITFIAPRRTVGRR